MGFREAWCTELSIDVTKPNTKLVSGGLGVALFSEIERITLETFRQIMLKVCGVKVGGNGERAWNGFFIKYLIGEGG